MTAWALLLLQLLLFTGGGAPPPPRPAADASPRICTSSARHATPAWLPRWGPRHGRRRLPSVMSKRLVRLGHSMRVFPLLDGAATQVRRVEQLVGALLLHRLTVAARRAVADDPATLQRQPAGRV